MTITLLILPVLCLVLLFLVIFIKGRYQYSKENEAPGLAIKAFTISPGTEEANQYRDKAIHALQRKKKYVAIFFAGLIVILPAWFFGSTLHETLSFNKEVLGQQTYNARMNDTYLYTFVMLALISIITIPGALLIRAIIHKYIEVLNALSPEDMLIYKKTNESSNFLEKYWVPYIIKENEVLFMGITGVTVCRLKEVTSIDIREISVKNGLRFVARITTGADTKRFKLGSGGTRNLPETFIMEALRINPSIVVTKSTGILF